MTSGAELLPPGLLARLERMQLATRRPLLGGLVGEHRSLRFGSSMDFSDYRQYHPGDDLRRLDINAYARLDRLMLKLFEADDDLTVRLLIDTSASMEGAKLQRVRQVAAAIGFVALAKRDIVTVHTFPVANPGPRLLGRNAAPALFDRLASLQATGETHFSEAVIRLLSAPGPPGITVVFSDLLTPEWEPALRRLPAGRGELAVVQVLDPSDIHPDLSGDLQLVDRETGQIVDVSATAAATDSYADLVAAWIDEVSSRVRGIGAGYAQVLTTDDLQTVVLGSLLKAGALK